MAEPSPAVVQTAPNPNPSTQTTYRQAEPRTIDLLIERNRCPATIRRDRVLSLPDSMF
jgi:hypothetical protein